MKRTKRKKTKITILRNKTPDENSVYRTISLDVTRADKEKKSIPVTISTEHPVDTWRGKEVLIHSKAAVDLSRADRGLPLLDGHFGKVVGRVSDIKLSNKKLKGNLTFSRSEKGQEIFQDVLDGILTDVSVGGSKETIEENSDGSINVTRWMPLEVSLEAIPADPATGINRNLNIKEGATMETEAEKAERLKKEAELIERGKKIELKRRQDINGLFHRHMITPGVKEIFKTCKDEGHSIERSRELLLDQLGENAAPAAGDPARGLTTHGESAQEKFKVGVTRALSVRTGSATDEDKKDIHENEYASFSPIEIARQYLTMNGFNTKGLSRMALVGEAFTRGIILGSATSSDFPNILADVANKSMLLGYNEIPETWSTWCRTGNLTDFKEALRVNLSEFSGLDEVPEAGEYSHGKFTDLAEKIKLLTYGKLFTISRQALINDDLSALGQIPRGMGRAAQRLIGDLAYSVLIDNPVMNQDDTALFHVDHNNLVDTGAPSVEILDAMRVAMALQKGPANEGVLGIRPGFIIVPLELEGKTRTLIAAQYDPAAPASNLVPNPEQGRLTVVPEHRLSEVDPAAWYLSAPGTEADTVEVAFLDGNSAPYLEQQDGFTRDGVSHKVRIDAAAAPMDYRGMAKNDGTEATE